MVNSIKKWRYAWFAVLLLVLFVGLAALSQPAFADIASGTEGTCSWVIDDDGIVFNNTMKPGFLKIIKNIEGETDANSDSNFMFRITIMNDKVGIDAGSEYYVSNGD